MTMRYAHLGEGFGNSLAQRLDDNLATPLATPSEVVGKRRRLCETKEVEAAGVEPALRFRRK